MAEKSFGVKKIKLDGDGTPTIESPSGGNLNITAATTTASGNLSVGGDLTVSGTGTPTIASPSGGNLNVTAATAAFSGDVTLADVKKVRLGNTAGDFDIYYDNNAYLTTGSRGFIINSYINSFAINGGSNSDFKFGVNYLGTISAGDFVPGSDNTYDLGIASINWRNLYLDGTANVGSLISSGNVGIATGTARESLDVEGKARFQGGLELYRESASGNYRVMKTPHSLKLLTASNGNAMFNTLLFEVKNYDNDRYGIQCVPTGATKLTYNGDVVLETMNTTPMANGIKFPHYALFEDKVGINQSSPERILHVGESGTAEANIRLQGGADYFELRVKDSDNAFTIHKNIASGGSSEALRISSAGSLILPDASGSVAIESIYATSNNFMRLKTTTGTGNFSAVYYQSDIGNNSTFFGHSGPSYTVQHSGSQTLNPFYGPDSSFIKNNITDKGNFKVMLNTGSGGYNGNRNHFVVTDQGSATLGITTTRGGLHSVYSGTNGDVIALGALGAATNELDNVAPDDDANTLIILPGGRNKEGTGGTLLFNSYDNDHGYSAILGGTSYGNNGGGFMFASNTGTRPTGGIDSTNSSIIEFTRQGDIVLDAGQGINFSNTSENGEASPDDVLFNDFERGTWIPSLSFAYSGNNTGISYAWREGQYIKFDKLVTCWGALKLNNKGSSSGAILLDDLPFAVENVAIHENIEGGGYTTKMQGLSYSTERSHWSVTPIQSVNYAYFRRFTGSSSNDENPNQGNISSSWEVHFTFQYYS